MWNRRAASIEQADAYALQADLLAHEGRYEEAIHLYDRALQLDPKNADLWAFLGITLEGGLNRSEEALRCWDAAVALDPELSQAFRAEGPDEMPQERPEVSLPCSMPKSCRARLRELIKPASEDE